MQEIFIIISGDEMMLESDHKFALTIANKLSKPFTFVGTLENFWSKASEML